MDAYLFFSFFVGSLLLLHVGQKHKDRLFGMAAAVLMLTSGLVLLIDDSGLATHQGFNETATVSGNVTTTNRVYYYDEPNTTFTNVTSVVTILLGLYLMLSATSNPIKRAETL